VVHTEDCYHVEAFRKHRHYGRHLQFYVKWVGYPETENTWQSASQLQEDMIPELYQDLLRNYLRRSQAKL
jgi:hypothetical protein